MYYEAFMVNGGSFEAATLPQLAENIVNYYAGDEYEPMVNTLVVWGDGESASDMESTMLDTYLHAQWVESVAEIKSSREHERDWFGRV